MPEISGKGRETWATKTGAILALIGVAVGLGNVWRFPYMLGKFGGAAFLAVYLFLIVTIGIPALWAEFTVARYTKSGPATAFIKAGLPGGKYVGWLLVMVAIMAVSYYLVVIGWVLWYFLGSLGGMYTNVDAGTFFENTLGSMSIQAAMDLIVLVFIGMILLGGIRKGIERASKIFMPFFYLSFIVLILRVFTLPGAMDGLAYYLKPNWSAITPMTILASMGQVFFSLGLGATWIFIYGSHLSDDQDLVSSGVWTAFGDTAAAFLAGLVVLPAVFAFGIDPASGPPLIFITLPEVFKQIPGGLIFAALFFLALFLVAVLSAIPGFEIVIDAFEEKFGWDRKKTTIFMIVIEFILGLPTMYNLNFLLYNDLFWGSTMLPIGSLIAIITFTWILGRSKAFEELRKGSKTKFKGTLETVLFYWIKFVLPIFIILTLLWGWYSFFTS
ncbi:sodium-dependent transporter [Thermococcus argininiproducens]|uniref:Sodium-dependent transporter n=1 Tax=Thermococcus argininiproducens TaxID=2866384 RepID=A0A9E7M9L3_9EURY|nr:sodium-dependent transporter [Thermococcus argininiproducens]USG99850.1 sodium-dependent transporter [Thermococcus argininiproducens]